MEECVLYVVSAATVVMQWFDKHVSTIDAMFSAWSLRRLYNDSYIGIFFLRIYILGGHLSFYFAHIACLHSLKF
jgi:hypothetical protein